MILTVPFLLGALAGIVAAVLSRTVYDFALKVITKVKDKVD